MAFDLSSASPVAPQAPQDQAPQFDLSSSAPVAANQPMQHPSVPPVQPQNWIEQQLAKVNIPQWLDKPLNQVRGYAMGAADPSVGIAQTVANLPLVRDIPVGQTQLSDLVTGKSHALGDVVNQAINEKNQQYENDRALVGRSGIDAFRLAGNFTSPNNLVAAKAIQIPAGLTVPKLAGVGGAIGAGSAATIPIVGNDQKDFWTNKVTQAVGGAIGGALMTPALSKTFDVLSPYIAKGIAKFNPTSSEIPAAQASLKTDEVIANALKETGQTIDDIPGPQLQQLRDQVIQAFQSGKQLDAAALMRKKDFESLGIDPLLGQITRDPTQFAAEKNLRGVQGIGEPIMARLTDQNQKINQLIGALRGNPSENFQAGSTLSDATAGIDKGLGKAVTAAYTSARNDAGKDLDVPLSGVAQDYAQVLNDFGDKVPSGVRNNFNALGLLSGKQTKTFTIQDVDNLQKVINSNWSNDPATNLALGKLNSSLKNAVNSVDATGGPFANAVNLAKQRFSLQEAVPALKAASTGSVNPDDFVRQFIVGGKTDQVKGLANLLQTHAPDAYQEAKSQLGDYIYRAAFGPNPAGDNLVSPARLADAIRKMGTDKLQAFFTPAEVTQMKTTARVGAYINSTPNGAPVNYPNTAGALANLLNKGVGMIPGGKTAAAVIQNARSTVAGNAAAQTAMKADVPTSQVPISAAQRELLSRILIGGGAGVGGLIQQ